VLTRKNAANIVRHIGETETLLANPGFGRAAKMRPSAVSDCTRKRLCKPTGRSRANRKAAGRVRVRVILRN
jgi:hypothetical protein